MNCPHCEQPSLIRYGSEVRKDGTKQQLYKCKNCQKRCNERTGTPMARLRTSAQVVSQALKMRTEGLGVRATGRVLGKSHASIICWERHVAAKEEAWSPKVPDGSDVTVEGDEVYTRVGQNLPPLPVLWLDNQLFGTL